jgi:hypothetical protein
MDMAIANKIVTPTTSKIAITLSLESEHATQWKAPAGRDLAGAKSGLRVLRAGPFKSNVRAPAK